MYENFRDKTRLKDLTLAISGPVEIFIGMMALNYDAKNVDRISIIQI